MAADSKGCLTQEDWGHVSGMMDISYGNPMNQVNLTTSYNNQAASTDSHLILTLIMFAELAVQNDLNKLLWFSFFFFLLLIFIVWKLK